MANNVYFPAIKNYDTITSNDWLLFYPIVADRNKYEGGIDGLPRKMNMGSLLTFLNSNLTVSAAATLEIKDEGISINTNFTKVNFTGPFVTVTDATGGEATVNIVGNLVSDLADVSANGYMSLTSITNGTLVDWAANKPHYTTNGLWIADYDNGTYMIGYDPVGDIWRPMLAKDYLSNGSMDTNFATDNLTFTAARTHDIAGFDLTINDGANLVLNSNNSSQRVQFGYGVTDYFRISKSLSTANLVIGGNAILDFTSSLVTINKNVNLNKSSLTFINSLGNTLTLLAPGTLVNTTYRLPSADGTLNQVLGTDGAGTMSWIDRTLDTDTNFAISDLTATANRSHNFASFNLLVDNVNDLTFNAENKVSISAANNVNHVIQGIISGSQRNWEIRADDGTDNVYAIIVSDSTGGTSKISFSTGASGGPILLNTTGYIEASATAGKSGEFRLEGVLGGHYIAHKIDINATGAVAYSLIWPNKIGSANDVVTLGAAGAVSFVAQSSIKPTESLIIAASDETTDLTVGTVKTTFRMPYAFTVTEVRASLTTAPTGSILQTDINANGTSILGTTKIRIDATEKTSTTAVSAPVISTPSIADDAEITIDVDAIGSTTAGAGLKVYLIGYRT